MTLYVGGGARTLPPESLTFLHKAKILFCGVSIPRPVNTASPADLGLIYKTVRFGGPADDDCEAWYVPTDSPKALCIQFHAYASSKSSLLQSARAFHDAGFDVLMVDFRGSGGSHGSRTSLGYFEAEDVAAAVDLAASRYPNEPVVLYGQSMGGAAILRAIADFNLHPRAAVVESAYDRLLSTVENRFHAMRLPAFPLARLLLFWGGWQQGYSAFKLNPADYAKRVKCPVLVMQGGCDARVTNAQARNLFDHIAGPKQFEYFADSGHCAFMTNNRDRWNSAVIGFLDTSLQSSVR